MYFSEDLFTKKVPKWIVNRTRENVERFGMCLDESFEEAVKSYPRLKKGSELWKAWFYDDFRAYLPCIYRSEYLDFSKYPRKY